MITQQQIWQWLQSVTTVMNENKDYLTELDAAIGDADHGVNMNRGFQKVLTILPTVINEDIGAIFKKVSMTLISSVGGASGPLYGTLFLKLSTAFAGKWELNDQDMVIFFRSAVDGIVTRGKAQLGDKTMLDTLIPASEAFQGAIAQGETMEKALELAINSAELGMRNTIPLIARIGRASYLGDRSINHQDPGATSVYLLLLSLGQTLNIPTPITQT